MVKSVNYAVGLANKTINGFLSRPLVRDTVTTTFFSTIGKAVGFLVPFFIAAWFGVTGETDAFFFAYGLILFFSMIFAPTVEGVIVPYIAEAKSQSKDVGKFVGRILGVSGLGRGGNSTRQKSQSRGGIRSDLIQHSERGLAE